MLQRLALALVVLFTCYPSVSVTGDSQTVVHPLIQDFGIWETLTPDSRLTFYAGWENGLFTTTKDPRTLALGRCLEKLSFEQIVAMVDKRHAEHPEALHNPISMEIIKAVTVAGGPCEGIRVGN